MKTTPQRLDDFVREKLNEPLISPLHGPPFGLETSGELITAKQFSFHSLEFLHKFRGVTDFSAGFAVIITVPRTGTGVIPLHDDDQPCRWTGKINEAAADMAAWWAFDLLTESEAREFMAKHKPEVIFQYMEHRRLVSLTARFEKTGWFVNEGGPVLSR